MESSKSRKAELEEKRRFCLWHKRLEKQFFRWPQDESDIYEIDHQQLDWLLGGLEMHQQHADETYGPGLIISDISKQIIDSKIIIADITPANPNVYYEVGYAHALNKPTILIAEKPTELPFDVSPFRTLFYENSIRGKKQVEDGLRKHIQAILTDWYGV